MKNNVAKVCDIIIEWCLYLLFFCIPFAKAGIEIFSSIAITAWIVKKVTSCKLEVRSYFSSTKLNKALGAFVIVNLLSTITSVNFALSMRGFFGKVFEYAMLYFIVVEVINNKKRIRNMLIVILISAVFMIIDSLVQYFSGYDFLRHYSKEGYYLTASFTSHNDFGGWLILLIPLFLCLLFLKELKNYYQRLILGVLGLLLLICLLLTYSRGAWIGFLLGIGFILGNLIAWRRKYQYKLLILFSMIICLIGAFVILPVTMKERLGSIADIKEGSALARINAWRETLNIIEDYPLFGSGLNTYSFIGPRYKMFEGGGIYPHNSFLHMAAETGVIGLVSFVWILVNFFKLGIRTLRERKNPLLLGLLSGILGFLVQSFFDTHLYSLQLVVLFWFMMGLTVAVIRLDADVKG